MEIKTDFGEWNVPTEWNDLTLTQLQDIQRLSNEEERRLDVIEMLHILCNKTKEEVAQLPIDFVEAILEKMEFLKQPLPEIKPSDRITIKRETYIVNVKEKLTAGEFVATQMAIKGDKNDYATLLAILARKEGEKYTSEFENETLKERREMFANCPALEVMPLITFFLQSWMISMLPSQLRSVLEEEITNLEVKLGESTLRDGVGNRYSIWRQKKALKKLKKSLKAMC